MLRSAGEGTDWLAVAKGWAQTFSHQNNTPRTLKAVLHTHTSADMFTTETRLLKEKKTAGYLYTAIKNVSSPGQADFPNKRQVFCAILKMYHDELHVSIFNVL